MTIRIGWPHAVMPFALFGIACAAHHVFALDMADQGLWLCGSFGAGWVFGTAICQNPSPSQTSKGE